MPRFAANLSLLYQELPLLSRFAAAAQDGFRGVEILFPYEHSTKELADALRTNNLQMVLLNAPPGNWAVGERGIACIAGSETEFQSGIAKAVQYAKELACPRIHVVAGLLPASQSRETGKTVYESNLRFAANEAAKHGIDVTIEPINTRDMPGFFLNRQDEAHGYVEDLKLPNLKVQMDLYHCQIVEGDLATKLKKYLPTGRVGHMQIAGVPERHEPDIGEINYEYLFRLIDELGYTGWLGCEYFPSRGTSEGLGWLRKWRESHPDS